MAWQDIFEGETDINSPITQTLMDKIRNDLDWLHFTGNYNLFHEETGAYMIVTAGVPSPASGSWNFLIRFYDVGEIINVRAMCRAYAANLVGGAFPGGAITLQIRMTDGVTTVTSNTVNITTNVPTWKTLNVDISTLVAGNIDVEWKITTAAGGSYAVRGSDMMCRLIP